MAQRRSIITLEKDEREVLKAATAGVELENILRRMRKIMGQGLDTVKELSESRELDYATLLATREVLQRRLDLMRALPALDEPELLAKAERPLTKAIALCEQLAEEQFPDEAAPEAGSGGTSAPAAPVGPAAV